MDEDFEPPTCTVCGKSVVPGQARNGLSGNHWDCDWPQGYKDPLVEARKALGEVEQKIERLRRRL